MLPPKMIGRATASTGVPAPTEAKERIASLDVIRGVAVFGILLMNITWWGLPPQAAADPTVYGGAEGANLWAWILNAMLIEGTQRGLFTLLFGAGVVLFMERMEASQGANAADIYFRRNLWLIVFGLLHGFVLLWLGDILFFYGIIALFAFAFRKAKPATLLWLALGGLALNSAWHELDAHTALKAHEKWQAAMAAQDSGKPLQKEQTEAIEGWDAIVANYKPDASQLQKVVDANHRSYFAQVVFQAPKRSDFQSVFLYRGFFDLFSMMLMGMALFKLGLLNLGKPSKIYWAMSLGGYAAGLTVNIIKVRYLMSADFSVLALLNANVVYDLGRVAVTVGHVGLLMLICNSSMLSGLKRRLAAVGQMAFTSYVSHSIICAFIFFGFGFGQFGRLQRYQLYYVVIAIWTFQLIVSPIWLAHYRYGPLEWLWRSLTYRKLQPMRRGPAVGAVAAQST